MRQAQAFLDAGLPYEIISEDDVVANPALLGRYEAIGLVFPKAYESLSPPVLKTIVRQFEKTGGVVWRGDPVDGHDYHAKGYSDPAYLDSLRAFFDTHDLSRHRYSGYGLQIWGNRPFLFVLSRLDDVSGTIELDAKGWGLPSGPLVFTDLHSGRVCEGIAENGVLRLDVTLRQSQPYLSYFT